MSFVFSRNARFSYKGFEFEVWATEVKEGREMVKVQKMDDEAIKSLPIREIISDPSFVGLTELRSKRPISEMPPESEFEPEVLEEIDRREAILKPILLLKEALGGDKKALIELVINYEELGVNADKLPGVTKIVKHQAQLQEEPERNIWRWLASYNKFGKRGLMPKNLNGGDCMGKNRVKVRHPETNEILLTIPVRNKSKDQIEAIEKILQKQYLAKLKISKASAAKKINDLLADNGVEKVSKRTLDSIISKIPKAILIRCREGEQAWKNQFKLVQTGFTNNEAMCPLHIVALDHTTLDIMVVDEEGNVIGRPVLTVGLDLYSRMPWAVHLSLDYPSTLKVKRLVEHGVSPKNYKVACRALGA